MSEEQYKADTLRVDKTLERYRDRFRSVHGSDQTLTGPITRIEDYKMFGDIINVVTMNALNRSVAESYMEVFVTSMQQFEPDEDEITAENMLELLLPVLRGMFEHSWMLGWMYRDEQRKERMKSLNGEPDGASQG